jgi:2-oxoglutarate dehydrogenase complex dehydrogenase (E1) component-like enzyme
LLSEYAALGFEYGYSVGNGDALVAWEAQFGDFINNAQGIVDEFVAAGEDKWDQLSGLVMLLPHGYEGQGPDHSSARLERFLTLGAEDSIQVVEPSTPANYFHALRRQLHRSVRKPLIVMTPKWLLRLPEARSATAELVNGHFLETLDDPNAATRPVPPTAIILCSGKIYYQLVPEVEERGASVALVRMEQFYPFPEEQLMEIFERYPNAREVRWVQEEPENMGAWTFIYHRLSKKLPDRMTLSHAARAESASPATGSSRVHEQEHQELMDQAFDGLI